MRASAWTWTLLLAVAAGAVPMDFATPEAHAVVACQKGKRVRLRPDACKKKETRVTIETDPLLPPAAAEILEALKAVDGAGSGLDADVAQGMTPRDVRAMRGMVVRDANGAVVGRVLGSRVLVDIGGHLVDVFTEPAGFVRTGAVFFESSDCTGTPYLPVGSKLFLASTVLGDTLYHQIPDRPLVGIQAMSFLFKGDAAQCATNGGSFTPPGLCCMVDPSNIPRGEATTVDLPSLGFVPPFRGELR